MKVECEIVLEYRSEDVAKAVFESVSADNGDFVISKIDGRRVIFSASARNPLSLSHTINDLLACVKAAESSLS